MSGVGKGENMNSLGSLVKVEKAGNKANEAGECGSDLESEFLGLPISFRCELRWRLSSGRRWRPAPVAAP